MESLPTVGIVAPDRLQEPLAVLLQAAPSGILWASATTVAALLALPIAQPPDEVLLYVCETQAVDLIQDIKCAWPDVRCIAFVDHTRERIAAEEAGADAVLLQGSAPRRLLETLERLRSSPSSGEE